jgi:hypothetical protein
MRIALNELEMMFTLDEKLLNFYEKGEGDRRDELWLPS